MKRDKERLRKFLKEIIKRYLMINDIFKGLVFDRVQ